MHSPFYPYLADIFAMYYRPSKTAHEIFLIFTKTEAKNLIFLAYSSQNSCSFILPYCHVGQGVNYIVLHS